MDLPPKLDPVMLTANLSAESWRLYKELRDEFAAWLTETSVVPAAQAGIRCMRLAQICGGYVGGLQQLLDAVPCPDCGGQGFTDQAVYKGLASAPCSKCSGLGLVRPTQPKSDRPPIQEIGREKLDVLLEHVERRIKEDRDARFLIWCRFRPEMERVAQEIRALLPRVEVMHGGQTTEERRRALHLMHPDAPAYEGPAGLVGTLGTGSMGLNLAGAHEVIYYSNDWSLVKRLQSEDRPVGPGQTQPVSYHDIIAVGPRGQRTVEHEVVAALRAKDDLARWSRERWIRLLKEE
jgi:SNF2 family DNA or RNA helicase